MGRKGGSSHTKRLASPSFWPIHRKEKVWVAKTIPGPHPISKSLPLLVILRDILGVAETAREAGLLVAEGNVKVDGVTRSDVKFPVGLMDILEIPSMGKAYRVISSPHRMFRLHEIGEEEKTFKLAQIENKSTVRGGDLQLNLHDGRNILVRAEGSSHPEGARYTTLDTVKIDLGTGGVVDHFKFVEGAYALITGGKNVGRYGRIERIEKPPLLSKPIVTVQSYDGKEYNSVNEYIFIIGRERPAISLPEGG